MDPTAQTFVALVVAGLAFLLALRLLFALPGLVRRIRRPEARGVRVIGVGGAGSNAVDRMLEQRLGAVDLVACNTDSQALRRSRAPRKVRIGRSVTAGLGSGGDPEIGRTSAEEDATRIADALAGADLVFVTAGLGGGTGSGAAPVVARLAKEQGSLTIGVVTKPFTFEGTTRQRIADEAARQLIAEVDALIVIPNDRMSDVLPDDTSVDDAFRAVDGVLAQAVKGILDLLVAPGMINLDFADICAVVEGSGPALIGVGRGSGDRRAFDAASEAIASPLLEASLDGARNILLNVVGPADLQLREVRQVADEIRASADPDVNLVFGASRGDTTGGDVVVTLIATGLDAVSAPERGSAALRRLDAPAPRATRRLRRTFPAADGAVPETVATTESVDAESASAGPRRVATGSASNDDYDVPSFLRRGRTAAESS